MGMLILSIYFQGLETTLSLAVPVTVFVVMPASLVCCCMGCWPCCKSRSPYRHYGDMGQDVQMHHMLEAVGGRGRMSPRRKQHILENAARLGL
eukprot:5598097-Prymnesium_polylepis.1